MSVLGGFERIHAQRFALLFTLTLTMGAPMQGQWLDHRAEGIPRLEDGSPDLSAPLPKTDEGRPVLSGTWVVPWSGEEGGGSPPPKYLVNLAADLAPVAIKMRPWAEEILKQRIEERGRNIPMSRCLPPGPTLSLTTPLPFKILETPGQVTMLYESSNSFRQIFTDGRALPPAPNPQFLGYSVGSWDGDDFVVDSRGFNERFWLDGQGHPHTETLHLTERYRRLDFGHMDIDITVDDPVAYLEPWTVTLAAELVPDGGMLEYVCQENEKSVEHIEAAEAASN